MGICPLCNKNLNIPEIAERNLADYNNILLVKTLCCGGAVRLHPINSYRVYKYEGTEGEDDWGSVFES